MADLKPMELDTSAYLADTGHLTTIEHGAYFLLLMAMHRSADGWIDGSDAYLARASRMTAGRWKRIAPTIRKLMLTGTDGRVTQKRVQKDRARAVADRKRIPSENPNSKAKSLKNNNPPSENPRSSESTPFSLSSDSDSPSGRKKESKYPLPDDWKPDDAEILYGKSKLGLTDDEIDRVVERMRRWAIENRHRQVAKKSRWDLALRNWLEDYADKKRQHPNAPAGERRPQQSRSGFAALALDLNNDEEER